MTRDLHRCEFCGSPYCPNDHERAGTHGEHYYLRFTHPVPHEQAAVRLMALTAALDACLTGGDMRETKTGAADIVVWALICWFALVIVGWIIGA